MRHLHEINDCNITILLEFPNGLFNYIQACIFSQLKLLLNCYVIRTVLYRQDLVPKFNLTYPNGTPVTDILNCILHLYFCKKRFLKWFPLYNMLQLYFRILYHTYILLLYFCKKGFLKCFSLHAAIILPRKSIVEVYYTCILLLYFTTEV